MSLLLALLAAATSQLSLGGTALKPADYVDGRASADGSGAPVVMLTLTPEAVARLRTAEVSATLDGRQTVARVEGDAVVISGAVTTMAGAAALAKALTGRDPLPDSLED